MKEESLTQSKEIFKDTNVNITTEGQKYLGGFIGSDTGKIQHIQTKVDKWIQKIECLSVIAKFEPQAAYTAAFVSGLKHKLTYHLHVNSNIKHLIKHLDHIIDTKFIPAITNNRTTSSAEWKLLSLSVCFGGLGIPIFSYMSNSEYNNS